MPHIFVYGSLKRGFKQHERHMKGAHFVAATKTKDAQYTLMAVLDPDASDHYPSMKTGGQHKIVGELYEVSEQALRLLDEYEGEHYNRVTIALENGQTAFTYIFTDNDIETATTHPRIRLAGDSAEWIVS